MPKQEFPFPMPNGWFCVTRVGDIQSGESKPFTFCEKEVVAFRTESGKVSVLDAYCGYSGINLAMSGKVDGETIKSPKHGIKWNIDGSCAEIGKDSGVPNEAMDVTTFSYPCRSLMDLYGHGIICLKKSLTLKFLRLMA